MIIRFNGQYLSITPFEQVDLPDLTVLTGVNGSGKTHLLQAIQNQRVIVEGIDTSSIISFNYETFKLENEQPFSAHDIRQEKENAYNFFDQQIRPSLRNFRSNIANDYTAIQAEAVGQNIPYWNIRNRPSLQNYKTQVSAFFGTPHMKGQQFSGSLLSLIKSSSDTIEEITREGFEEQYKPLLYKNDFLPQALGRVIWDYYVRYYQNECNGYSNEKRGTSLPFLTDEEFIKKNGEKPWVAINKILKQFSSLEYEVTTPEGHDIFKSYQMQLVHTQNSNLKIDFSSLSSGERVLMALVASVFKSASDNNFPDLLLLDELDATLHPSMMKNMLGVIGSIFLDRGTKVILVTHSPSTVAFAPEDAVFVMNKSGENRVEKRSKKDALAILTEGFATLDDGMLLFDQVAGGKYSIITEGRNTRLLMEAFRHFNVDGINILDGIEASSGKSQLKTLFDFMCKVPHNNSAIFVWDCDVNYNLAPCNNTYPIFLPRNPANSIAKSGIENMFNENLFEGFVKTITRSKGPTIVDFDETRKKDFEEFIISRNNAADFENFRPFIEVIKHIKDAST